MDVIVTNIGDSKLEAIRIIRNFTSVGLKDAKDFSELAEKNYCVAISNIPQDRVDEVLGTFAKSNIQARVAGKADSFFRTLSFNPSGTELEDSALSGYRPLESTTVHNKTDSGYRPSESMTIYKKTDGSLKGYLRVVASMESQLWNQNRLVTRLKQRISGLGCPKNIEMPQRGSYDKTDSFAGIMIVSFFVLGIITLYNVLEALVSKGFLSALLTLVVGAILSFGIPAVIFVPLGYALGAPDYKKAMAEYETKSRRDKQRVDRELVLKKQIQEQLDSVEDECKRTKKALNALYSLSIIHSSYRNLVAVSSLYDYIDKGICKRLEGRDGAYAFYEEELRFQRIESKLDIIIEKLDQIASNQEYLASLIREGNSAMSRIEQQNNALARKMGSISVNTALAAYNTRCCAESLAIMESISIYKYIKS